MVFIAVCALWLSGLKHVYRLCPKCSDKIGAPECVVLRTLAAVYLRAEKLSKVSRPSALTPWFRPDDRQMRYRTAFVPRGDTKVAENPKALSKLLSWVCWHGGGCWYLPPLLLCILWKAWDLSPPKTWSVPCPSAVIGQEVTTPSSLLLSSRLSDATYVWIYAASASEHVYCSSTDVFNVMDVGEMPEAFGVGIRILHSVGTLKYQWVGTILKLRGFTLSCDYFPSMHRMGETLSILPGWCLLLCSQDHPPTACLSLICWCYPDLLNAEVIYIEK